MVGELEEGLQTVEREAQGLYQRAVPKAGQGTGAGVAAHAPGAGRGSGPARASRSRRPRDPALAGEWVVCLARGGGRARRAPYVSPSVTPSAETLQRLIRVGSWEITAGAVQGRVPTLGHGVQRKGVQEGLPRPTGGF